MKKIEAIIQPCGVAPVKEGLTRIGVQGVIVTEVKGFGGQSGLDEIYRGMRCQAPYHIESKIEVFVPDEMASGAVAVIRQAAHTEEPGGVRIFVSSLDYMEELPTEKKTAAVA